MPPKMLCYCLRKITELNLEADVLDFVSSDNVAEVVPTEELHQRLAAEVTSRPSLRVEYETVVPF